MKSNKPWRVRSAKPSAAPIGCADPSDPSQVTRRQFIERGAGAGALLALPVLAACGNGDGNPATQPQTPIAPELQGRALFFNLSHENHAGKRYWLTGGGKRYALTPVAEQPEVLRRVRQTHAFLRGVPDDQITHHIESAAFNSDSVTLCYVSADLDVQAGTWSMSSTQLIIPPAALSVAFARARQAKAQGPLPLSAKRKFYGLPAAMTEQDLREERDLLDATSHAATLVGCHPDLMSLEPIAAGTVHANHVDRSIDVYLLGQKLKLPQYGAAQPQANAGQPNQTGWATLQPVLDQDGLHGVPLINTKGLHKGRIQYQPALHPDLRTLAGSAMTATIPDVKNDTTLGADITGLQPQQAAELPPAALAGAMWLRHDGLTRVDQSPNAGFVPSSATMTKKAVGPQYGYYVKTVVASGSPASIKLELVNWLLMFRGVFVEFLDANGNVLELENIPEYKAGTIVAEHPTLLDTKTQMYVGTLGPTFTVLAVPVAPGYAQPSFKVPQKASTVRILASSLSFQGGNVYSGTVLEGAIMTGVFNYGVTALMAAIGGGDKLSFVWKDLVVAISKDAAFVAELKAFISAALGAGGNPDLLIAMISKPGFWISQGQILAKLLFNGTLKGPVVKAFAKFLAEQVAEEVIDDSLPVVGEIMEGISITIGVLDVLETTTDLALAPWTYVDELVFTHDLSVTILKDPNDNTFPKAATSYSVAAMFDEGTPHVQTFALTAPVPSTLPPVVFKGVPLGGSVNISVAFVQKATTPGQPDILLGKGTTGPIPNTEAARASQLTLAIQELKFPISANTVYQHKQKTTLDANGNHRWAAGDAPIAKASTIVCGGAGTVCAFRSITVRQGTGNARGYVGYAWQGQNSNPAIAPSCVGGGVGQLDQVANLSTDSGNNGANAQAGYANAACGITVPGVRVAYSLLTQGGANFYLDTTDPSAPMLRQVQLDGSPQFQPPLSKTAWGVLNFKSDTLLLHPAGHLVSINNTSHKIETHRLPKAPLADADAKVALLAQPKSGKGSRPGLLDSPGAAAVSADGVILVLESGNNRIQALDLGANPVRHFKKQASPYSLTLSATDTARQWQYLDLAVEFTGFIYVLSYNTVSYVYRLDIYHPDQTGTAPIATTMNVNAARLTVDFWRSVYTLNYEVLKLPDGASPGLTEPSVSLWTPCDVGQTC